MIKTIDKNRLQFNGTLIHNLPNMKIKQFNNEEARYGRCQKHGENL